MTRNTREPAELPPLNEDTPALDEPAAVEWWHGYDDDGSPKLDTFHGFHDATQVADDEPPAVETGELITESGVRVSHPPLKRWACRWTPTLCWRTRQPG